MVAGGVRGCWGGHACFFPGGGACVVFGGGGVHRIRRDTVNERAVCILLECILVLYISVKIFYAFRNQIDHFKTV